MQLDLFEANYEQQLLEMKPEEIKVFGSITVHYEGKKQIFNWLQPDHVWHAYRNERTVFVGKGSSSLAQIIAGEK